MSITISPFIIHEVQVSEKVFTELNQQFYSHSRAGQMGASLSTQSSINAKDTDELLAVEKKWDISGNEQNGLDIACYNVYFKGFDRKGTIDAICEIKVDILVLQETNSEWEQVITNNSVIKSKFKHIKCVNDQYGEGGTILLSKHEIKSIDIIDRYHKWWYGSHRFILNINKNKLTKITNDDDKNNDDNKENDRFISHLRNRKDANNNKDENDEPNNNDNNGEIIQLYSVHLIAPFPPNNFRQCGCCCCCCPGESRNEMRLKELKHCLNNEFYDDSLPTLIIGDFNCMDGDCHEYLRGDEFGLKSSWDNYNDNKGKSHNYVLCCKHSPYSWRGCCHYLCCCAPKLFDHIYFSSQHFRLIYGHVIKIGESDHYPICAKLEMLF